MSAQTLAVVVGLASLLLGFGAGYLFARRGSAEARRQLETEERLREAEDKLSHYREDVATHFHTTAELVNRLTSDYREVHAHLANGAQKLCSQDGDGPQLLESLAPQVPEPAEQDKPAAEQPAPPLDYAPRRDRAQPGVLQEEYGFQKSSN